MSYYELVILFPILYVSCMLPGPTRLLRHSSGSEEQKRISIECTTLLSNRDRLQSLITVNANNRNNLARSPQNLQLAPITLPSRHPKSLYFSDRRQQVPNNTVYTSSSPGVYRLEALSIARALHARDLDPRQDHKSTTEEGIRRMSRRSPGSAHSRPRRAWRSGQLVGILRATASCVLASRPEGMRRVRGRGLRRGCLGALGADTVEGHRGCPCC